MFATTTWPTPESPAHAAPPGPEPRPEARVLRVRVARHVARPHRVRRGVALPRVGRAETYVVRIRRPDVPAPLRVVRCVGAAPHRARAAAA